MIYDYGRAHLDLEMRSFKNCYPQVISDENVRGYRPRRDLTG